MLSLPSTSVAFFGGEGDVSSLVYRFCHAVLTQKNITLLNNGESYRDFVPVGLLLALFALVGPGVLRALGFFGSDIDPIP